MKISERAYDILLIIDKATDGDEHLKNITRYWLPGDKNEANGVWGAGDARCLRSMETKGLIRRMPATEYSYAITEEGRLLVQESK